jgi:hypothetical protein
LKHTSPAVYLEVEKVLIHPDRKKERERERRESAHVDFIKPMR